MTVHKIAFNQIFIFELYLTKMISMHYIGFWEPVIALCVLGSDNSIGAL